MKNIKEIIQAILFIFIFLLMVVLLIVAWCVFWVALIILPASFLGIPEYGEGDIGKTLSLAIVFTSFAFAWFKALPTYVKIRELINTYFKSK